MTNDSHDHGATSSFERKQHLDGISHQSSTCTYCKKTFEIPAFSRHQNRCKAKKGNNKHCQTLTFCILNDSVFQHILSFLTNQTLTKLQMITGHRYPDCKPQLARYCCKCENDNPVILRGLCRECEATTEGYEPLVSKKVAKERYCVKDILAIPCQDRRSNTLYDRVALENHMLASCGSKLRWLRVIAKRGIYRKQQETATQRREYERRLFLESLTKGFSSYVESVSWKETNEDKLESAGSRFVVLSGALETRGLRLRVDSYICKEFILWGYGYVSDVVDTMEEMNFLFTHTDYEQLCAQRINALQDEWGGWFRRELMNDVVQKCREKLKAQLCIDFLVESRGIVLPQKWESCRPRFEEVTSLGIEPKLQALYIYSGVGCPQTSQM
ncbi:hypothetical protein F444_19565 [Phytophthora nicotianae P1976]|uniref:Uncharacterized protein n=1 Tax=Phytophthora nicotianae P1976 TaxID=1317066 RepID=A0A080Z7C7_PHYNI|nr:hypothetical protein F444_19565 [Phytophthora nicotianae P1976]